MPHGVLIRVIDSLAGGLTTAGIVEDDKTLAVEYARTHPLTGPGQPTRGMKRLLGDLAEAALL